MGFVRHPVLISRRLKDIRSRISCDRGYVKIIDACGLLLVRLGHWSVTCAVLSSQCVLDSLKFIESRLYVLDPTKRGVLLVC